MQQSSPETVQQSSPQTLDLRGVSCPINWVRTKLALEEMEAGDLLLVILDEGEPILNVPRSARNEGHKIVNVHGEDTYFRLLIRKDG